VIKFRKTSWAGHEASIRDRRGACKILGKPEERNYLQDPAVDGRTILKLILEK
jgi:hypothetical protein